MPARAATSSIVDQEVVGQLAAMHEAARPAPSTVDLTRRLAVHGWRAQVYDLLDLFAEYSRPAPSALRDLLGTSRR